MTKSSRTVWCACLVGFLMSGQAIAELWSQTTWDGGPGQQLWSDTTMYYTDTGMDWESSPGDLMLRYPGWENTGELVGAAAVLAVIQASDGSLYAGTFPNGDVFRSTDAGTTWVNTSELPDVQYVTSVIQASDEAIYALVPDIPNWNGRVYKTTDDGTTWVETGDLADAQNMTALIQAQDGAIYASGSRYVPHPQDRGVVFKTTNGGATWTPTGDLVGTLNVWVVFEAVNGTIFAGANVEHAFWTTDGGATWNPTDSLDGWIYTFVQDYEGALYAGAGIDTGHVFKSIDGGTTWADMGELPGSYRVESLLHASDEAIYAGTCGYPPALGAVFRSTNAGTTWVQTGDLDGAYTVHDLLQTDSGTIYAGTSSNGDVFKWCPPKGDLVSSVFDAGPDPEYGTMSWDETLNGQTLLMKVRTDTLQDMSTGPDWPSCPPAVNGDDISSLSSVDDGDPYVQYRVEMVSSSVDSTPVLHEVRIEYTPTGVEEEAKSQVPVSKSQLLQNQPNPFTQKTAISYQLSAPGRVALRVYDLSGKLVKVLVDAEQEAGPYSMVWSGRDTFEYEVPSGIYFYDLTVGDFSQTKKLTVLR